MWIFKVKKKEFIPENPLITVDVLENIERELEGGKIKLKDFKILELLLENFESENIMINSFKEYGIESYEEFIMFTKNKGGWLCDKRKLNAVQGPLKGTILGTISGLKKYLENEI